jgi:hypothetical protein
MRDDFMKEGASTVSIAYLNFGSVQLPQTQG